MNNIYFKEYQELLSNSKHLMFVLELIRRIPYCEVINAYNTSLSNKKINEPLFIDNNWVITKQNLSIKIHDRKSCDESKREFHCYIYESVIDLYVGKYYCVKTEQFITLYNLAHNPELINFL